MINVKKILADSRTHWQWYQDLYSMAILRYFVLWFSVVPLVLKSFDQLPFSIKIKSSDVSIFFEPELPFSWVLLWIASVCYTASLLIFVIRCPGFIRKYPSFNRYQEYGHSPRWMVWLVEEARKEGGDTWDKLKNRLLDKGYAHSVSESNDKVGDVLVEKSTTRVQFKDKSGTYEFSMPINDASGRILEYETDVAEREVFWEVFGAQSGWREKSRGAIILLLCFAAILFSIVLIQHICAAIPYVFKAICGLVPSLKIWLQVTFNVG